MKRDNRDEPRIDRAIKNTRIIYNNYPFACINITKLSLKEVVYEIIKVVEDAAYIFDEKTLQLMSEE